MAFQPARRDDEESGLIPPTSQETSGTAITDFLPIPDIQQITDPDQAEKANHLTDEPTLSHALATDNHEEKGAAQMDHDHEDVADLGWHKQKDGMPDPLVGGLDNEELWLLIRRFNKQMYHVKEVPNAVPGNLDLNISDEEEFSPDKLRANVERLYMTVIIGLLATVKHIARLRSWRETRRTTAFCAVSTAKVELFAALTNLTRPTRLLGLLTLLYLSSS
jgi:hypothetical protein